MTLFKPILLSLLFLLCNQVVADSPVTLRIGTLAGGTLAWELAVMKDEGLPTTAAFTVETVTLANQQAGKIALQSGSVDMILSDWIWASAMRDAGTDYSFYPYSTAAGGLMVANTSPIQALSDLQGKRIGIAGGELDKNWLLLQALAKQQTIDLAKVTTPVYGAAPLLNEQLKQGRIDALLTYWHFGARLEAQGYRQLIGGDELLRQLGIAGNVPTLGYVFRQSWAEKNQDAFNQFLTATQAAKKRLCDSDAAWAKVATMTDTPDPATQLQLRKRYCQGRIVAWGDAERAASQTLYALLHGLHDNKLTGPSAHLNQDVFWRANR